MRKKKLGKLLEEIHDKFAGRNAFNNLDYWLALSNKEERNRAMQDLIIPNFIQTRLLANQMDIKFSVRFYMNHILKPTKILQMFESVGLSEDYIVETLRRL